MPQISAKAIPPKVSLVCATASLFERQSFGNLILAGILKTLEDQTKFAKNRCSINEVHPSAAKSLVAAGYIFVFLKKSWIKLCAPTKHHNSAIHSTVCSKRKKSTGEYQIHGINQSTCDRHNIQRHYFGWSHNSSGHDERKRKSQKMRTFHLRTNR